MNTKKLTAVLLAAVMGLNAIPSLPVLAADEIDNTQEDFSANSEQSTEPEEGTEQTVQEPQETTVETVQRLIDSLPTLKQVQNSDKDQQRNYYDQIQVAYEAYESLSENEKEAIYSADIFEVLFGFFNGQIMSLDYSAGNGTQSDPYQISTAADLQQLATDVNGGSISSGTYFVLTQEIDLSELYNSSFANWIPIGSNSRKFMGNFNGNGLKITGLFINNSSTYQGLFGSVGNTGVVQNLSVEGTVTAADYVGGIAGDNSGSIENCTFNGEVTLTKDNAVIGGIAGINSRGTIKNCFNYGTVVSKSVQSSVGGIAGYNSSGIVENCSNHGLVQTEDGGSSEAGYSSNTGGIVGNNQGGTIQSSSNRGEIKVTGGEKGSVDGCTGGITGRSYKGTVINSSNNGSISTNLPRHHTGGIAGWVQEGGEIANCSNTASVMVTGGNVSAGEIVGLRSTATIVRNCYFLETTANDGIGQDDQSIIIPKTKAEYESGLVCWLLQNGQADKSIQIWGQTVGEGYPELTALNENAPLVIETTVIYPEGVTETEDPVYLNPATPFSDVLDIPVPAGYELVWTITGQDAAIPSLEAQNISVSDPVASITGQFSIKSWEITFDPNGGTFQNSGYNLVKKSIAYDSPISADEDVSRLGYEFLGWSATQTGDVVEENNMPADGLGSGVNTLYAQWRLLEYEAILNDGQGQTQKVTYTAEQPLNLNLYTPVREGYTFDGWELEDRSSVIEITVNESSDPNTPLQIYARWIADSRRIQYVLIYPDGSQETLDSEQSGLPASFTYGSGGVSFDNSAVPKITGYEFAGWYSSAAGGSQVTVISEDNYADLSEGEIITLYGQYGVKYITVTFDASGGSFGESSEAIQQVQEGQKIDFNSPGFSNPDRSGYQFEGWFTEREGGTEWEDASLILEPMTLFAHWTENKYQVAFETNGGILSNETPIIFTITNGFSSLPEASRPGYIFLGWKQTGIEQEPFTEASYTGLDLKNVEEGEIISLEAVWKAEEYMITFDSDGGSAVSSRTYTIISGANNFESPSRNGFTFLGWFDTQGNEVTSIEPGTYGNISLKARWKVQDEPIIPGEPEETPPEDQPNENPGGSGGYNPPSTPSRPNAPEKPDEPAEPGPDTPTKPDEPVNPEPDTPINPETPSNTETGEGWNNNVQGEGAGFTEPGSQTQTNPETGMQTTFTQSDEGVKSAVTQKPDGTITNVDVAIPSEAINAGKVTVDLGTNQQTGEIIQLVPGNISDLSLAPNVNIELSENSGRVIVEIPIKPGTVVAGTVGMLKEDGSVVPITLSAVINGSLFLPLDGSATIVVLDNNRSFADVPESNEFYNAIEFVASREIMNGVSEDEFNPLGNVTRGMLSQILWNISGRVTPAETNDFDIPDYAYYKEAAAWANAAGYMTGYSESDFGGEDLLTREQLVTVLWRFSGKPYVSPSALNSFPDSDKIGDYAREAMAWAVTKGIIQGDDGSLNALGNTERYQVAIILQRFIFNLYS